MKKTNIVAAKLLVLLSCWGCGDASDEPLGHAEQAISTNEFGVSFADCTEFAGIGLVPAVNVRSLVPQSYTLAQIGDDAIVVVRVADCDNVSVDGAPAMPARVAQVGASVAAGDPSASINNYTLFFATNLGQLHGKLKALGVESQLDADIEYAFADGGSGDGTLALSVTPPMGPSYQVSGDAHVPELPPGVFVATWWADTGVGAVQMRTEFPNIRFNFDGDTTLSTAPGSALSAVIGGTTLVFPLLDSYNAFESAALEVTLP